MLLEHVLSEHWLLRPIMRWLDPVSLRLSDSRVARDTVANVRAAGGRRRYPGRAVPPSVSAPYTDTGKKRFAARASRRG